MEQLLKMTHQEWMAYLQALPEAQRQKAKKEIAKAVANRNLQMMLENLNTRRHAWHMQKPEADDDLSDLQEDRQQITLERQMNT